MAVSICTLFEGSYHYGLGALVNSLYAHGFRGTIWAGYRGALPPWARPCELHNGQSLFKVSGDCTIRFVALQTERHLTNYKPDFMLQVFDLDPTLTGLVYFDPDITIRCDWAFFADWIDFGIALVQDITNGSMPSNHPIRMKWIAAAKTMGLTIQRESNQYFNGGFIGVRREFASCLSLWKRLIDALPTQGIDLCRFMPTGRTHPFSATDQDTLNLTTMLTEHPISTIGPEGMDFVPGGFTMSHSVGSPKPWNKRMIAESLDGRRPSAADHAYLLNAAEPIPLHTTSELTLKRMSLQCAAAIGRLWNRS